jgi:adenine-specific DNA-methyltransferase
MESLLSELWGGEGQVVTFENDYKRYVGAQIGIYSPQGEKVGKVSHLRNREYLYVAAREDLTAVFGSTTKESGSQLPLFSLA